MASEMEFVNYKDFVENLSTTENPILTDKQVVSNLTNGPRAVPSNARAMANEQTEGKIKVYGANGSGYFDIEKIFNNFAGKFVDNVTEAKAGKLYMHNGTLYEAKEDYTGVWASAYFEDAKIGDLFFVDKSLVPTEPNSLSMFGCDKFTGKKELLDGGLVASATNFNNLENDSRGIPYKLDIGATHTGQIVASGKWAYTDMQSMKCYIIDVSRIRGMHVTDSTGVSRTYSFLTSYVTPSNGDKAIFCNGVTLSTGIISSVLVPYDATYMYIQDSGVMWDSPWPYCDEAKFGIFTDVCNAIGGVYGKTINDIPRYRKPNCRIAADAAVSNVVTFDSTTYRYVGMAILPTDKGVVRIEKVMHSVTSQPAFDVVVCDKDDVILGGINYTMYISNVFPVYLNLADYPGAIKIYFNYSSAEETVPNVSIIFDSIENKVRKKGVVLLHFDAVEFGRNGSIVSTRKALLEEYGIKKASACLNPTIFGNGTGYSFYSWRNQDLEAEYWRCIKDGWDFALYPAMVAQEKTEEEWNAYMDTIFGNLAALNIHNITTWACGRLDVTHALLNACIKHNIKIVRGGSDGDASSSGDYVYTADNIYMPTANTYQTTLVNKTMFYGTSTDIEQVKPIIRRAADTKTAISIFTHQVEDTPSSGDNCSTANFRVLLQFIKSMVDAGEIEVMSWREYYASASARDGYENDYNRLVKMSS